MMGEAAAVQREHPATSEPGPGASLATVERWHVTRALEHAGGNVTRAARALGVDRKTLHRKLRDYGLRFKRDRVGSAP